MGQIMIPQISKSVVMILMFILKVCDCGQLSTWTNHARYPQKIVIAHRGASGYLPEHTLEAKSMAAALSADYLEQDLVLTKDNVLMVMHDIWLDTTTNVADIFPNRARPDGRFYVIDFTYNETQRLKVSERFHTFSNGTRQAVFTDRFPLFQSTFRMQTFEQELQLIQGIEKSTGKAIGIYTELKKPWFHTKEGKDITTLALHMLKKYGYTKKSQKVYLQCFDANELKNRAVPIMKSMGMNLKVVQLIPTWNTGTYFNKTLSNGTTIWVPYNYTWMLQSDGMQKVSKYAAGIGPYHVLLVDPKASKPGKIVKTGLAARAHAAGLVIHPFTFRREASQIPDYANKDFIEFLRIFYDQVPVDGVFTDFSDIAVAYLQQSNSPNSGCASVQRTLFSSVIILGFASVLAVTGL